MTKKQLIALHSWVGLKLSVLMFIVTLTGTLAVLSHEIDWLIDSDMRVDAQQQEVDWDTMAKSIRQRFPERQLFFLSSPMYANFASIALTIDPELGARRTLVNPYTGEVLGDKDWYASAQRVLRDLHRYLLSPIGGIYLVGPLAVVLLISVITALLFYRKWWRGFFKIRISNGSRAFWGSLHKVSGLWSLWFILLISITGVWYLIEAFIADIGVNIQFNRPSVAEERLFEQNITEPMLSPSEAISIAENSIENYKVNRVFLPRNQRTPYFILGQTDALLVRDRSNHIFINPVSGQILRVQETYQQNAFERWIDMADPLHFGNFAGLSVKFIWFGFGLLISGLTLTGIVIFIKRIKNRMETGKVSAVLGGFKYATFLILLIPITVGTIKILDNYGFTGQLRATNADVISGDNFDVKLSYAPQDEKIVIRYNILCDNCLVNIHNAHLVMKNGETYQFSNIKSVYKSADAVVLPESELNDVRGIILNFNSGSSKTLLK